MANQHNAESAINHSVQSGEIVTIDVPELDGSQCCADLLADSEDHVENGRVNEYWGTTDDGDDWRVHVREPARYVDE